MEFVNDRPTSSALPVNILIATYNRAGTLKKTLESFVQLDFDSVSCRFIIVDNNSTDETKRTVEEFSARLPLVYLHEPKPGKNAALNKALREIPLSPIIIFTDDDVTPNVDWLQEIRLSCEKFTDILVFGGAIQVEWPLEGKPEWAVSDWLLEFGFAQHQYGSDIIKYPLSATPFGPNYWIRSEALALVPEFNESIGPNPNNRIMGSESSFLLALQRKGVEMLHVPSAIVRHRITDSECRLRAIRRRAFTMGRGQIRLHGLHRANVYHRSRPIWYILIAADKVLTGLRYIVGLCTPDIRSRCEKTVHAMIRFGKIHESLIVERERQ